MEKIAFVTTEGSRKKVWNPEAEQVAAKLGLDVRYAATLEEACHDADGIMTSWGSPCFSRAVLADFPKARIVGHAAGSVGIISDATTYETGVKVFSANPVMSERVAQWALMMILGHCRHLFDMAHLRKGEMISWELSRNNPVMQSPVIGIWGLGDITKHLLKFLEPLNLGPRLVWSRHAAKGEIEALGAERAESFDELLEKSDVLLCFAGLTPETFRQLDAAHLAKLRDGSCVINAGRANLIDVIALRAELRTGRIKAILDVFETEPVPADSEYLPLPGLVMTPHMGAGGGTPRYAAYVLSQMRRFFDGKGLEYEIDARRFATMTDDRMAMKK